MMALLLLLCPLYLLIAPVHGSTCYDYSSSSHWDYSFYCENGCCGQTLNQYCCTADGAVAGAVIGSIVGVAVLAAIIIVCIRYHTRRTVIVNPTVGPATTVAVVAHGAQVSMYPTQTYPPGVYMPNANSYPAVAPPPYSNPATPAVTKGNLAPPQS